MKNGKMIALDGRKVPVSRVKHWRLSPEGVNPRGREWQLLDAVKEAWERLDASHVGDWLGEGFSYGSYWVADSLDKAGYLGYLPKKFASIGKTGTKPDIHVAVLRESLTPDVFPYALHLTQGEVQTLLTFTFLRGWIEGLYMTDPEIFTWEPAFRQGGILDGNGEPRVFAHHCPDGEAGKGMTEADEKAFAVECVAGLFTEAGASVGPLYKGGYREFPNIVVRVGDDTFYHRVRLEREAGADLEEFAETARSHGAWASDMEVSLFCFDTDGREAVRGGSFAVKVKEGRAVAPGLAG